VANDIAMSVKENVIFVANQTGWSLDYIGRLPCRVFTSLVNELYYLRRVEIYRTEYRLAQIMCILASDKTHRYRPQQFIGEEPKRLREVIANMGDVKDKPTTIILADGNEYELPIIDVNVMEAVEDEFDKSWEELFTNVRAKTLKAVMFYLLKQKYPDITREQVGALVTVKVLLKVSKAIAGMA